MRKKFTLAVSLSAGNLREQERAVLALVAEGTAEDVLWLVLCRLRAQTTLYQPTPLPCDANRSTLLR